MRALALGAAGAVLALAACGQQGENASATAENVPAVAEPLAEPAEEALQPVDNTARPAAPANSAGEDELEWAFADAPDGARIAYGEPRTDNVRLMLRCAGDGHALLSFTRPAEELEELPATLTIASGGSTRSLTIETRQGELGTTIEAQAPLSSGPLQQLRAGRDLEVRWGDETFSVPGAEPPVRQFFEACT